MAEPNARIAELEGLQCLHMATITLHHLIGNGSTHSDPFAAIAELADNAVDAQAKNLNIDLVERNDQTTLQFIDDGCGMTRQEALDIVAFGHSEKKQDQIGQYGLGLKSGSFYLGRELLILTKKDRMFSAVLISHKFHEDHNLEKSVIVPCPSWTFENGDYQPVYIPRGNENQGTLEAIYETEMRIIRRYAPLSGRTFEDMFSLIKGEHGTVVIIGNLRRSLNGEFAINNHSDPNDLRVDGEFSEPRNSSLREYLSCTYAKAGMQIHLRQKLVTPKKMCEFWVGKSKAVIKTTAFKDAFLRTCLEREQDIKRCEERVHQAEMKIIQQNRDGYPVKTLRATVAMYKQNRDTEAARLEMKKEEKKKIENNFKNDTIVVHMGVETQNRNNHGLFVYINNRLVTYGYKDFSFFKSNNKTIGFSAYVNLNSYTFSPLSSKQGLKDQKDFNLLLKKVNDKLNDYYEYFEKEWLPKKMGLKGENLIEQFWNKMGYQNAFVKTCEKQEVTDMDIKKLMVKECPLWRVCLLCGTWRISNVAVDPGSQNAPFRCRTNSGLPCKPEPTGTDDERFNQQSLEQFVKKRNAQKKEDDRNKRASSQEKANSSVVRNAEKAAQEELMDTDVQHVGDVKNESPSTPMPSVQKVLDSSVRRSSPRFSHGSYHSLMRDELSGPSFAASSDSYSFSETSGPARSVHRSVFDSSSHAETSGQYQHEIRRDSIADDYAYDDEVPEQQDEPFADVVQNQDQVEEIDMNNLDYDLDPAYQRAALAAQQFSSGMGRLNKVKTESEDEDDEEMDNSDEEEPTHRLAKRTKPSTIFVAKKKQGGVVKKSSSGRVAPRQFAAPSRAPKPPSINRAKRIDIEDIVNRYLVANGKPEISNDGDLEKDLQAILQKEKDMAQNTIARNGRRMKSMEGQIKTALDYLLPQSDIRVPKSADTIDTKLRAVCEAIEKKKVNRRRT